MKKLRSICALFTVSLILFMGCPQLTGDPDDPGAKPPFSFNGAFKIGKLNSYLKINEAKDNRSITSRASGNSLIPLEGILDDGENTFILKGFYDSESDIFTLSAATDSVRYNIGGDANKVTASLADKQGADDEKYFDMQNLVSVESITPEKINKKMIPRTEAIIIPSEITNSGWTGVWNEKDPEEGIEHKFIIDEWGMKLIVKEGGQWIEVGSFGFSFFEKVGEIYNVVMDFPTIDWEKSGWVKDGDEYFIELEGLRTEIGVPLFLTEKGYTLFDPEGLPLISENNYFIGYLYDDLATEDYKVEYLWDINKNNCLFFNEAKYLEPDRFKTSFPTVEAIVRTAEPGSGGKVVLKGIELGGKFVRFEYQAGETKPIAILSYDLSGLEFDYVTEVEFENLLPEPTKIGTYPTIAAALIAAETKYGSEQFKASDYLSLDATYMSALRTINDKTKDLAITTDISSVKAEHIVPALSEINSELTDAKLLISSHGYRQWTHVLEESSEKKAGYDAWAEDQIAYPELDYITTYQAMQFSQEGEELIFKFYVNGQNKAEMDTYAEAKALITGTLKETDSYILVR